jgi:uncharacterized protein (DUF362 family)
MEKAQVSVVRYEKPLESLRKAVELAGGFSGLKPSDKVVIKPNALFWDEEIHIPPFGVFTTTRMVEDLVALVKEFGCTDIAIGEGSVELYADSPTSLVVMENLGYGRLRDKYGVKLIDFNESQFVKVPLMDGLTVQIAEEVLSADFLIDVPAMKTHSQTKVSLGFKNLKGCLKTSSKRMCHHRDIDLDLAISLIGEKIDPDLVVIDGIYVLEKGPIHTGNAYKKDLIIVSKDILGADVVATELMGISPADIGHLAYFAQRNNGSLDWHDYDIRGETVDAVRTPIKWDWGWNKDNTGPTVFERMNITGVAIPKYDSTLCTGCSPVVNMANIFIISAQMKMGDKPRPFSNFELLSGKRIQARPGYDKTILVGNCIIKQNKDNPNIKERIEVKGCPPPVEALKKALTACGVDFIDGAYDHYMKQLSAKYDGKEGYDGSFYV